MDLQALLEERACDMARSLGHRMGALRPASQGNQRIGACLCCGAKVIVNGPAPNAGIRGTACRVDCRTRLMIRPVPTPARLPGSGVRRP